MQAGSLARGRGSLLCCGFMHLPRLGRLELQLSMAETRNLDCVHLTPALGLDGHCGAHNGAAIELSLGFHEEAQGSRVGIGLQTLLGHPAERRWWAGKLCAVRSSWPAAPAPREMRLGYCTRLADSGRLFSLLEEVGSSCSCSSTTLVTSCRPGGWNAGKSFRTAA